MQLTQASEQEKPVCPHCEQEIEEIKTKQFDKKWFRVTDKYVYFCSHCRKVLGVSHSTYT